MFPSANVSKFLGVYLRSIELNTVSGGHHPVLMNDWAATEVEVSAICGKM